MPLKPPQHRPQHWKPKVAWERPTGQTTTQRGYGTQWQRLRIYVLTHEPWCRPCKQRGEHTRAVQVDHIKPKAHGGTDDLANLQPICTRCHRVKTATEGQRSAQ